MLRRSLPTSMTLVILPCCLSQHQSTSGAPVYSPVRSTLQWSRKSIPPVTPQSSSTASPVCSESRHAAQPQPLPLLAVPTLPPAFIPPVLPRIGHKLRVTRPHSGQTWISNRPWRAQVRAWWLPPGSWGAEERAGSRPPRQHFSS